MDLFLGKLLYMLESYPEPVLLVVYGDHLPSFEFAEESLTNANLYQTEYIIWSNDSHAKSLVQNRFDLEAYQLSSYIMTQLGLHVGTLTKYHQLFMGKESYLENLELLEYDMLYGEQEVYGGKNPYQETQMQMGTHPVKLSNVVQEEDGVRVYGRYLNPFSKVFINEEEQNTEFISVAELWMEGVTLSEQDQITIRQIGRDKHALSETPAVTYMRQHDQDKEVIDEDRG
jgi:hypothetical protein